MLVDDASDMVGMRKDIVKANKEQIGIGLSEWDAARKLSPRN
jgi:hypothetical protein